VFPRAYDDWMSTSNVVSEYDPFSDAALRGEPAQAPPRSYATGWARLKTEYEENEH
jgi:hypothetical protein